MAFNEEYIIKIIIIIILIMLLDYFSRFRSKLDKSSIIKLFFLAALQILTAFRHAYSTPVFDRESVDLNLSI